VAGVTVTLTECRFNWADARPGDVERAAEAALDQALAAAGVVAGSEDAGC
jgi:hypothetical protein